MLPICNAGRQQSILLVDTGTADRLTDSRQMDGQMQTTTDMLREYKGSIDHS